ncbi:MAG: hypothetical protein ACD_51C00230G0002 [uncultured bacterium]|nr:MAG: hypothetical protein ACD_51C00230G0002 [uncultured bacterium]OGJ48602.1 MAG: hypothetical protein A2344_04855 [Candidatus Peregrinibacteria bacterium RIFOXYB12_FULL_41_12]OGJ48693.1 MAG: hypothetical protein A2244_03280 [Candidatus Peregrinibacteria bacterium RIFOXYA2_FULL_41_18]OGJ52972.1 MAG: hypothetical protein A2448_04145 [Candidatus Peregrinibacteria bacterium RIFOXYC2_FULL_41_22]OGJ53277.1 MAG: hypothetical protein A2336_03915 [Candidatus Peregrinibacteria bacterium RIFOXYB2_FULL
MSGLGECPGEPLVGDDVSGYPPVIRSFNVDVGYLDDSTTVREGLCGVFGPTAVCDEGSFLAVTIPEDYKNQTLILHWIGVLKEMGCDVRTFS